MNVGYAKRTHTASLWELRHLLGGDGPDVTLQVLLLHLHLLRQDDQQLRAAAEVEDCLWEDWPEDDRDKDEDEGHHTSYVGC